MEGLGSQIRMTGGLSGPSFPINPMLPLAKGPQPRSSRTLWHYPQPTSLVAPHPRPEHHGLTRTLKV